MIADSWIRQSLGIERIQRAREEADRRRLRLALGIGEDTDRLADSELYSVTVGLELRIFDLLDRGDRQSLCAAAEDVFQIARALPWPRDSIEAAEWLVRLGCLGVLGDRAADVRRLLSERALPVLPIGSQDWGVRVWSSILDIWIHLFRKQGWKDLDIVQQRVAALRVGQRENEPAYLAAAEEKADTRPAWELMTAYHLAKAAEILGTYVTQGAMDGHFDVREQLEAQFDRAVGAAGRGQLMVREEFSRLLARTAQVLVDNSIWTVTRAVNSRVTRFVKSSTSREHRQPLFEMLPPQRRTLREEGLLGSGYRSVVVSLPTSSGKTLIAEFRILQALNQFEEERGWIAYLAPTRALVHQLTLRLRRDFLELATVEKVSPALEVDGLEAGMLTDGASDRQFRILVTTPEKLDLLLRSGWEEKVGRPLTLVIVDEAHGLASATRGLKLELLLATINRECRYAQFLLLTPFIHNGEEIARWLSPDSFKNIDLGVDWTPNDRAIVIARAQKGSTPGDFGVQLITQHTTHHTLELPENLHIGDRRPLGLSWSAVSSSPGKLAAATAQALGHRGTMIILVDKPRNSWGVAKAFMTEENRLANKSRDLVSIQKFLDYEMGVEFPLAELLDYGVGVHHAGLSDDTRTLIEWLTEKNELRTLVATTTVAQGVNFPVSGVVFASHQYPYGKNMPPEDFWNIAGRAGRVDQGDIGVVALVAHNDAKENDLKCFLKESVSALNSTLIAMVQEAMDQGQLLQLESLSSQPGWSTFLQYLAHTYRQIGDHERFAAEVEQVLRGTLGFQTLRRSHRDWANQLVRGVSNYAGRIRGKSLKLVDATGFSWETVSNTLVRLRKANVTEDVWSPELFSTRRHDLQRMMGVLLEVPELRSQLGEVTGGQQPNQDLLTHIMCDWVQERPLTEMAREYFSEPADGTSTQTTNPVAAMTRCCQRIFGKLTQTASWGLAALQSLTLGNTFEVLSSDEQRMLRNLPARVYYGVNSEEAVALRLLGIPRMAAAPLSASMKLKASETLYEVRNKLNSASIETWRVALGPQHETYHRVWTIIEGKV